MSILEITVIPESISALGRHRKYPGKLVGLGEHIATHGLQDPLILTPEHRIIGGERCLLAILARGDGQKPVPALVVDDLAEATQLLLRRGSTYFKPMRAEEKVLLGNELETLGEPATAERRRLVGAMGGLAKSGRSSIEAPEWPGATTYIGQVHGIARSTYQRLRFIWMASQDPAAPEELRRFAQHQLDRIGLDGGPGGSVYGAYQQVRQSRLDAGLPLRLERRNLTPPAAVTELPSQAETNRLTAERIAAMRTELAGESDPDSPETAGHTGSKTRRKSLPDTIEKHTVALVAALIGLEKAQADDRWRTHREKLAPSTRNELLNAYPRIAGIVANLHPEDSRKEPTA